MFADRQGWSLSLGWLEIYRDTFKLAGNRLAPANLPALITHSRDWQHVPGATLPATIPQEITR